METAVTAVDRPAPLSALAAASELIAPTLADAPTTPSPAGWAKQQPGLALEIVKRGDDASGFVVQPRRWVVDRTLSWLTGSRRLVRGYESLSAVHEQMVLWSMTMLMSRRPARRRA
ncbi:hypothetical protein ACFVVA_34805 [Kitasatospora sp. NPDC058048]|uniref:hypothetical protein n=1 Tax=Kitasatospora sp. NPDC058048 TaxID=3346313 RepID=UPI0036DB0C86